MKQFLNMEFRIEPLLFVKNFSILKILDYFWKMENLTFSTRRNSRLSELDLSKYKVEKRLGERDVFPSFRRPKQLLEIFHKIGLETYSGNRDSGRFGWDWNYREIDLELQCIAHRIRWEHEIDTGGVLLWRRSFGFPEFQKHRMVPENWF